VERQCGSSGLLAFEESRHKQMQTSSFSKYRRTSGRLAWLFDLIERLGNPLPEAPILCGWPAFFVVSGSALALESGEAQEALCSSSKWLRKARCQQAGVRVGVIGQFV
jgi:hypothetical protein